MVLTLNKDGVLKLINMPAPRDSLRAQLVLVSQKVGLPANMLPIFEITCHPARHVSTPVCLEGIFKYLGVFVTFDVGPVKNTHGAPAVDLLAALIFSITTAAVRVLP